jgi:phosphoadenosine phosphosulfate reductase
MLIDTDRLTAADREAWTRLERYDHACYPRVERAVDRALTAIRDWWGDGTQGGVCSVSWGKDSTVCADLVARTGLPIPIVWVNRAPFEPPETGWVRDAFLAAHQVDYREIEAKPRDPRRGEPGFEENNANPSFRWEDALNEHIGNHHRYLSGIRADESSSRTLSLRRLGAVTRRTCRPIGTWTARDVFAYLAGRNLPVHPAYAMTYGGVLDRERLRVHTLCSPMGDARWEQAYFGDIIADALSHRGKEDQ